MKYFLCAVCATWIFISACDEAKRAEKTGAANDYDAFSIKRGTNIAHWLSQSNRRGKERADFFTAKDIAFIKSSGFDHIRLPVDEEQLWDSSGKRNEDAFQLLDSC